MKRALLKWLALSAVVGGGIAIIGGPVTHTLWDAGTQPADISVCPTNTCVSVTSPGPIPSVYPGGTPADVPVTIKNLTNGPLYVNSITVTFTNTWQNNTSSSCSASEFQWTLPSITGSSASPTVGSTTVTFPRQTLAAMTTPGDTWVAHLNVAMLDAATNQDVCEGQPLAMNFTANALYTVPTLTVLATTQNSGADTETLTATVGPDIQPAPAGRAPNTGDGTIYFYQCSGTDASTCTTPVGSTSSWTSAGVASITIPASSVGSYNVEAQFAPQDETSFLKSSSRIVTETLSGCVQAPTGSATNQITSGQTFNGNYTVPSGSSVWLNNGTITGNVTVAAGGSFAATGGSVGGNIQSNGGPIAIAGTVVNGNVQSSGGGLALGPSTTVRGNVQAQGGGPFCSQGSPKALVLIKGNLLVQSVTSPTTSSVCSTNVGNNLQWQSNASPGMIGLNCGPNTILGNLLVQNNSGSVTVGANPTGSGGTSQNNNNVVSGNINVSGNTGGGTLTANQAAGNCQLTGDKPGIVGSGNTANKANNQCNTSGAGA